MLPHMPPEVTYPDEEFMEYVRDNLKKIHEGKVRNGLYVKRLLLNTNQEGYTKAVRFLANMWRNKSALAYKSFEIEGEAILELTKIIFAANFIETSLERLLEANSYIHQLELAFSNDPRAMRLIENAYGGIERAQIEGINRILRLMEAA